MRAADQVEANLGPIDVWVNNAMVTIYASIADIAPEEFHQADLSGPGSRNIGGAQIHAPKKSRRDHLHRNRAGIPIYPLPGAVLRGQSGSPRLRRLPGELLYEQSKIRLTMVHLPGVNTPQFDWARDKFDRKLAPVPPIFQPETIADSVGRARKICRESIG